MSLNDSNIYDDEGNIILPSQGQPQDLNLGVWSVVEKTRVKVNQPAATASRLSRQKKPPRKKNLARHVWVEGGRQYKSSLKDVWRFLTQPVWLMHPKRKEPKQYNRLTLFLLDTVRFGGTFAAIFVGLFVALNYHSFWQITSSYLKPIAVVQERSLLDTQLSEKLLRSPSLATAGQNEGNLLEYLGAVGPPQNWLIIPALGIKVPLVTPSYQSLLDEKWQELETDIQKALELGVVHYPGTARPGQAGNFFVTGHSSYYPLAPGDYKDIFARLGQLQIGDEYYVYYGGDKHKYIVRHKKEVRPTDVSVLDQPIDKRMATLMTCTPVGTTLRRLILEAEEVDPITNVTLGVGASQARPQTTIRPQALPI